MRDEATIKLGMMLAVGGSISAIVFLRRFAWHDVGSVEKSLASARLQAAAVMRKVKQHLDREKRGLLLTSPLPPFPSFSLPPHALSPRPPLARFPAQAHVWRKAEADTGGAGAVPRRRLGSRAA
jgi:hypothetical protein